MMCSTAGTKNGISATTAAIPTHMNTENPTDITLNCGATRDTKPTARCAASNTAMTGKASHTPIWNSVAPARASERQPSPVMPLPAAIGTTVKLLIRIPSSSR